MAINEDLFLDSLLPSLHQTADVVVPPGDDCAALRGNGGELMLVAVDQVAEDSHYHGVTAELPTDMALVGRKLLARNLSDVAAMGGVPLFALTAIVMPTDADPARLNALMDGVKALADTWSVSLIGGDLTQGSGECASLTIIGRVAADKVCLRSQAEKGQRLFVTGQVGGAVESGRHLTFEPRLKEGQWLAEQGYTRCMIDVSDGLVKDLGRLCAASGVSAILDEEAVPLSTGCTLSSGLYDGEDYELLFAINHDQVAPMLKSWPFETRLTEIGIVEAGNPQVISKAHGTAISNTGQEYQHFKS